MKRKLSSGQSRVVLVFSMVFPALLLAPAPTAAKEDRDRDRHDFYGWVEVMPEGLHGNWIIGGQQVTTNPQTEFDQTEGPLMVGGCAKVNIRGGLVHEIDSEPTQDCR